MSQPNVIDVISQRVQEYSKRGYTKLSEAARQAILSGETRL